jgi:hypothetical protein
MYGSGGRRSSPPLSQEGFTYQLEPPDIPQHKADDKWLALRDGGAPGEII